MDTIFNTDGCFYRALDDEPIFVLLARDPCFAETIRAWETSRQALIGRGEKPQGDHPMLLEALATATAGVAWRNESTDPTNGYDAGQHARWHGEAAPPRQLVEVTGRSHRKGVPEGGHLLPYDEWERVKRLAMPLGNRFLIGDINGDLVLWENINYNKPGRPDDWTGYYPVNNSLQKDMLWCAYEDWRNQSRNTVAAIKRLTGGQEAPWYASILRRAIEMGTEGRANRLLSKSLRTFTDDDALVTYHKSTLVAALLAAQGDPPKPESVTATSGAGEIDPAKEALWIDMAEERGFLSAEDAEKARAALPEGTKAAVPGKHLTFIVRDLARKIATGLRQVTSDMAEAHKSYTEHGDDYVARHDTVEEWMDRVNGYAAELEAGEAEAARFRSRPIRMHPALGAPYEPQEESLGNPYKRFASLIDYQEMTVEDARKIVEDFRKRFPDVLRVYEGLPPLPTDEIILDTLESKPEIAERLRRAMTEPQGRWTGGRINPAQYAKGGTVKAASHEPKWDACEGKAESDTLDVTDTPEMPPHRFTMFTKARGWAYGRGLEINPAHIPDMLDRMETDGWHLQAVFGGVEPTKVGMLFKRSVEQHADFRKAWEWIGSWCGKGLWVAGGLAPHRLQQLRDRISAGERLYQDEEPHRQPPMPPSVAEMMAAPTEGVDEIDVGRGLEP